MLKIALVVAVLALAVYLTVRLLERRRGNPGGGGGLKRPRRPSPPPRPLGPDDDPDFLRELDRKRKRKQPEDPEV